MGLQKIRNIGEKGTCLPKEVPEYTELKSLPQHLSLMYRQLEVEWSGENEITWGSSTSLPSEGSKERHAAFQASLDSLYEK